MTTVALALLVTLFVIALVIAFVFDLAFWAVAFVLLVFFGAAATYAALSNDLDNTHFTRE